MGQELDQAAVSSQKIWRYEGNKLQAVNDQLTVEEPVELILLYGPATNRKRFRVSVNLLTPGDERAWAAGFLFCEGMLGRPEHLESVEIGENQIVVSLATSQEAWQHLDLDRSARRLAATASCGFCGKENLDGMSWEPAYFPRKDYPRIAPEMLIKLSAKLDKSQEIFACTGGLHAAGLFSPKGKLMMVREDIGRHNALDKLIGEAFLQGLLPLREHVLWLSGRIGFELVQKASMAGIPLVAAVGAPSSLAVKSAEICDMTLVGFLRNGQFNCYSGFSRIQAED
ncbi:MAG: formate dehydrogenase accessory sulfurtransferase FdhD [Bacteroidetes bacterium]|nr:formate dehydrogenase accessory sulfurtransferase FdhD [Bacteroidota bacterium]